MAFVNAFLTINSCSNTFYGQQQVCLDAGKPQQRHPIQAARRSARISMMLTERESETDVRKRWESMALHFVSLDVSVSGRNSAELRDHIEDLLTKEGEPVRWAIVDSDAMKGTVHVEAVVTTNA